jgi:hypothetical protein
MGAQDDYESLSELADRLFGEDGDPEKRDKWLSDHMRQLGHKARSIWQDADPDDGGNVSSGYFGSGSREKRKISGKKDRKDWMYG